jgi:peptidoglycan/xylan/chitin deacetylase (PgdA/CDA1 family)
MGDVLVLCYHAVSDRWPDELAVTPNSLRRQVGHALNRGYVATTFSRAVTDPPASRTLAVTFDDGYRSVLELGFPILERLGVPATLFVPSAQIATGAAMSWPGIDHWIGTPHADELIGASWEEVAGLAEAGWEIGSHTLSHPHLTELDDAGLATELAASREEIETRLGRPCRSIAYPYGDVDDRVEAATGRAGYTTGAALPASRFPRHPRPLLWPRLMVARSESDAAYRRHISPAMRRLRSSPAWEPATRAVPRAKALVERLRRR